MNQLFQYSALGHPGRPGPWQARKLLHCFRVGCRAHTTGGQFLPSGTPPGKIKETKMGTKKNAVPLSPLQR